MNQSSHVTRFVNVTGPHASGTTTFIRTLGKAASPYDPTMRMLCSMEYARLTVEDPSLTLHFLGTPGARRFDFNHDNLKYRTYALVLLASHKPETFRESRAILETMRAQAVMKCLVVATFQDHPDAWTIDELRTALRIASDTPIVPCVATGRESVLSVLTTLLDGTT